MPTCELVQVGQGACNDLDGSQGDDVNPGRGKKTKITRRFVKRGEHALWLKLVVADDNSKARSAFDVECGTFFVVFLEVSEKWSTVLADTASCLDSLYAGVDVQTTHWVVNSQTFPRKSFVSSITPLILLRGVVSTLAIWRRAYVGEVPFVVRGHA